MLFINKAAEIPANFTSIVSQYSDYDSLSNSGADRDMVKLILLNEQGCLCPYCECQLDISTATIEHFHPESAFKRLQLDYYNLFACCHVCNRNKTDHLIPAYFFDARLNAMEPNHLILNRHRDFEMLYYLKDGENDCFLSVRNLEKRSKDKRQDDADWMLFLTTELLGLNDAKRLREPRATTLSTIFRLTDRMPKEGLLKAYQKYRSTTESPCTTIPGHSYHRYESFLSMILYYLAQKLRGKGVDISKIS